MDVGKLLKEMTLEEKASLLTGLDVWHLKGISRLNVPSIMVSDGPHGLRKQTAPSGSFGGDSAPATCFPTACACACSFDRDLLGQMGRAIGKEARLQDVQVVLGPGANIKRSPLCGRNFEYFSEDPCLSGELAAAWISGVQSQGVGTSLKHFAANNQETRRMSIDVQLSRRALYEIYLASFEQAVKKGRPDTVMCSYNRVNGGYASQNPWLLTAILRVAWGFEGATITDWGACSDHVAGVASGMDIEMPAMSTAHDQQLVKAVKLGLISEELVTAAARRVLQLIRKTTEGLPQPEPFSPQEHHHLARKMARETMVLLKNKGALLPLGDSKRISFIGEFAQAPRYQGGGSSHINAYKVTSALEAVRSVHGVSYARGFDSKSGSIDPVLIREAEDTARASDVCVLFIGLPESCESEGFDRSHLRLPDNQLALVNAVCAVCRQVAVVLHTGAPVLLPFYSKVQAILCAYLGGEAVGGASVDLLFGAVSPCGKLPETWPMRLEDNPSYLNFPGDDIKVCYGEDIFVGYRWYSKRRLSVRFPFGFGLSYTGFAYSKLRLSHETLEQDESLQVQMQLTNTGSRAGKEIVQLYVQPPEGAVIRPDKELRAFEKVALDPGETKTLSFTLTRRDFCYWEDRAEDFHAPGGVYTILIGSSSADIRLRKKLKLRAPEALPLQVDIDTPLGDIMAVPKYAAVLQPLIDMATRALSPGEGIASVMPPEAIAAMLKDMPLRGIGMFAGGALPPGVVENLIAQMRQMG